MHADKEDPLLKHASEWLPRRPCALCGEEVILEYHSMVQHLGHQHPGLTVREYLVRHRDLPRGPAAASRQKRKRATTLAASRKKGTEANRRSIRRKGTTPEL